MMRSNGDYPHDAEQRGLPTCSLFLNIKQWSAMDEQTSGGSTVFRAFLSGCGFEDEANFARESAAMSFPEIPLCPGVKRNF